MTTNELTVIGTPTNATEVVERGRYFHPDDLSPGTVESVRNILKKSGHKVSRSPKINGAEIAKLLMSLPASVLKKLCEDTGE
jgi:hypothetical protein